MIHSLPVQQENAGHFITTHHSCTDTVTESLTHLTKALATKGMERDSTGNNVAPPDRVFGVKYHDPCDQKTSFYFTVCPVLGSVILCPILDRTGAILHICKSCLFWALTAGIVILQGFVSDVVRMKCY